MLPLAAQDPQRACAGEIKANILEAVENRGLPSAWIVECRACHCKITARALDPQGEHADPQHAEPAPRQTLTVTCSCCWAAYRYEPATFVKGSPRPNPSCAFHNRRHPSEANNDRKVILLAASLIAAVRLNRDEIKNTPIVQAKIGDSIQLARMIHSRLGHD